MIQELNEKELDVSFAGAFLEEWLKNEPEQIKVNLKMILDGVAHYRNKYIAVQEDYTVLSDRYNQLTALSASYLQIIQELRQQNEALLIETQREFHRKEGEYE